MTTRVIIWDWREQPDMDEIANAVQELSNGRVQIYDVDTRSDQFAIVISDTPLHSDDVAAAYRKRFEE